MHRNTMSVPTIAPALFIAFAATTTLAQHQTGLRVETTQRGTFLVRDIPGGLPAPDGFSPRSVAWTFFDQIAIPESVAISTAADNAWVAQNLNVERLQRFALSGSGTPLQEYPANPEFDIGVAAAQGTDLAATLDREGGAFIVRAFTSEGPLWDHTFPVNFTQGDNKHCMDVSRDGSTVAVVLHDPVAYSTTMWIMDGDDGDIRQTWTDAGQPGAVDLTDDGSLALVTHLFFQVGPPTIQRDRGKVIDTVTGTQIYEGGASGFGGRYVISGDGSTFATGSFDLRIFHRSGNTYVQTRQFNAPNSWFGWGLAVSRDGSTVGVMSHDYASGYVNNSTRVFDAVSGVMLGEHNTFGSGTLQGSISGAAMNEDGTRLAVSHWGTASNTAPEVMIFDRSATLIDSLDTFGSVFGLDMSDNGRYVLVGEKNGHANTFGNGGTTTLLSLEAGCLADFDGDGFVTGLDFDAFVAAFEAGDPSADFDGDGFITGLDFDAFVGAFEAGCD